MNEFTAHDADGPGARAGRRHQADGTARTMIGERPLPAVATYLPHRQRPGLLAMGLSRLDPSCWFETDSELAAVHAHKRALWAADRGAVFAVLPGAEAAAAELAALVEAHLLADRSAYYCRDGARGIRCPAAGVDVVPGDGPPLWRASLLVADDLLVMQPRADRVVLAAASLCSPSHWRLADKLGHPMAAVHDPVPGIHDDLSARIERLFAHLRVDAPVQRFNWSIQRGDARFAPTSDVESGATLYYRVERQTLRRLPASGAIAFTIRVYLRPLASLADDADTLSSLRSAIAGAPPALAAYKGFARLAPALAAFFDGAIR